MQITGSAALTTSKYAAFNQFKSKNPTRRSLYVETFQAKKSIKQTSNVQCKTNRNCFSVVENVVTN